MSKLYDIVNKIMNSNSMSEAEQILYGKDGIIINSTEYYQSIISNFIRKKEIIIKKEKDENGKTQLIFDLNNCNDLWNILFIYTYYINYIEQKIELLTETIKKGVITQGNLKGKLRKLSKDDPTYQEKKDELDDLTVNLNKLRQLKQSYENYKTKSLQESLVELKNMPDVDEDKLKEYIQKLKEAITCVQKLRDTLAHANDKLKIDNVVKIDNPKNKFEISIPIEYLDGFNKGRIVVNEEDKVLVQQTNEISLPLFEALDYDVKKIDSFFYNIEPNYLDFLLEKVNYDYRKLYKLSSDVFSHKYETNLFLGYGMSLLEISKLPHNAFKYSEDTIWLKEQVEDVTKLPNLAFKYPEESMVFLKRGVDISKLPESAFLYYDVTLKLLRYKIAVTRLSEPAFRAFDFEANKEEADLLLKADIDIYSLPELGFTFPKSSIMLYEEGIDVCKVPEPAFYHPEETIKLFEKGIDIYSLAKSAFSYPEGTLMLLSHNIDISKLPGSALDYPEETLKLVEAGIDIYKLDRYAFENAEEVKQMIEMGINIYELPATAFHNVSETIEIYKADIDIYKLPSEAFRNPESTIKLFKKGIDVYKAPLSAFYNYEKTISLFEAGIDINKLPSQAFYCTRLIIKLFKDNIDIYKLPKEAFKFPSNTKILHQNNIDILRLSPSAFQYNIQTINLFKSGIDIYKLPDKCFSQNIGILNLKRILEKVDYQQLDTLPIEFFECDTSMLDEMFLRYNLNISKSIFGIKNTKVIAALIYANRVLSEYNPNLNHFNPNIEPESIIANTCEDSFKYHQNISENIGKIFTPKDFVNQFQLTDENNMPRSEDEITKTILSKIRNASEHFRFKIVKDANGNILEDKIYLYDEDNRGINNFNLIINLNDLINIVRIVEKEIETNIKEETKNKSRK